MGYARRILLGLIFVTLKRPLGTTMFWETSGDFPDGTLLRTWVNGLGPF